MPLGCNRNWAWNHGASSDMTWPCGQNCPSLAGYSNMQETVHLFPSPCSVTSLRQHEISHCGDSNTTELGKYYKPKMLFSEAITSTSLILTDPTSQEVRWPQQCSSITWMWYMWDQIWASPDIYICAGSCTNLCPKSVCYLSLSLQCFSHISHLWTHEGCPMTYW